MTERVHEAGEDADDDVGETDAGQRDLAELRELLEFLDTASNRLDQSAEAPSSTAGAPSGRIVGSSGEATENRAIHRTRSALARQDARALAAEVDDLRGRVDVALERTRVALAGSRLRGVGLGRRGGGGFPAFTEGAGGSARARTSVPTTPSNNGAVRASARLATWGRVGDEVGAAALLELAAGLLAGGVEELTVDLSSLDGADPTFVRALARLEAAARR